MRHLASRPHSAEIAFSAWPALKRRFGRSSKTSFEASVVCSNRNDGQPDKLCLGCGVGLLRCFNRAHYASRADLRRSTRDKWFLPRLIVRSIFSTNAMPVDRRSPVRSNSRVGLIRQSGLLGVALTTALSRLSRRLYAPGHLSTFPDAGRWDWRRARGVCSNDYQVLSLWLKKTLHIRPLNVLFRLVPITQKVF